MNESINYIIDGPLVYARVWEDLHSIIRALLLMSYSSNERDLVSSSKSYAGAQYELILLKQYESAHHILEKTNRALPSIYRYVRNQVIDTLGDESIEDYIPECCPWTINDLCNTKNKEEL